ncbi:pLS20_p028 family conjugation system transmembrane protein [Clostridium paraputrificum]|uniref:pLS20_p028 family conjugation system transmembrane protein n=1 Tax=Clostridium paraputrificum TaxID=29363 RepID=UPI003D34CF18
MSDQQVINILQSFDGFLIEDSLLLSGVRWFGWWIIKGLTSLVNTLEGAIRKVISLTDFFDSPEITKLISDFKPAIFGFLALSLACVGLFIFFSKKFDRKAVPTNILLATLAILLLPVGMSKLNQLTQAGINVVYGEFKSMANETIKNNIIDVYKFDENNFTSKDVSPKNYISKEMITSIDINESIDKSQTKNEKVFENKVVPKKGGGYELKRIDGMFKIDNYYYRWKCNFWIIIISLLATAGTLGLSILKIGRLIFELAFNKVFGIFMAYLDVASGQRLKKIVQRILTLFAVMFCMALMLKIYLIFTTWISSKNLGVLEVIMMIVVSFAVIDGPNIVEEILGVDAGLSSAWKMIAGLYAGSKMGSELAKGAGKAASGLAKFMSGAGEKVAMGMAGGVGFATGAREGLKNGKLENQMDKKKADDKAKGAEGTLESQMKDNGIDMDKNIPNDKSKAGINNKNGELSKDTTNGNELGNLNKNQEEKSIDPIDPKNGNIKNKPGEKNDNIASKKSYDDSLNRRDLASKVDDKMNDRKESLNDINSPGVSDEKTSKNELSTGDINGGTKENIQDLSNANTNSKDNSLGAETLSKQSSSNVSREGTSSVSTEGASLSNKSIEAETLSTQSSGSSLSETTSNVPAEEGSLSNKSINTESLNTQSSGASSREATSNVSIEEGSLSNKSINTETLNTQSSGSSLRETTSNVPTEEGSLSNKSINTESLNTQSSGASSREATRIIPTEEGSLSNKSTNTESLNTQSSGVGSREATSTILTEGENLSNKSINTESLNTQSNGATSREGTSTVTTEESSLNHKSVEVETLNKQSNPSVVNNIIETRTISEFAKEEFKKTKVGKATTKVKRVYQIGKNSGIKHSEKKRRGK